MVNDQRISEILNKNEHNRTEIEDLRSLMMTSVAKKAELKDLEKLQSVLARRQTEIEASAGQLNSLRSDTYNDLSRLRDEILQQKQFMSEQLQSTILKSSHLSEKLTEELYILSEQLRQVDDERRADSEDIRKIVSRLTNIKKDQTTKLQNVYEEMDFVKKFIDEVPTRYSLRKEVSELKARVQSQAEDMKSGYQHNAQQGEMSVKIATLREEVRSEMKVLQVEMQNQVSKKLLEVQGWMSSKADSQVNDLVRLKVSQ